MSFLVLLVEGLCGGCEVIRRWMDEGETVNQIRDLDYTAGSFISDDSCPPVPPWVWT